MPERTCVRLTGSPMSLARALDILHLSADVLGVVEGERELLVALPSAEVATLSILPAGVTCEVLPPQAELTGLEDDAPVFVGESLCIRPPWVAPPGGFEGRTLVVPRGGAFGSGEHASTRAALLGLESGWSGRPASFLDVGTGSGILALYAHERGVVRIAACDIDAVSARVAGELVPGGEVLVGGPERFGPEVFDVVVANLAFAELDAALPSILARCAEPGLLVLSGMRETEEDAISARVPRQRIARHAVEDFRAHCFRGSNA